MLSLCKLGPTADQVEDKVEGEVGSLQSIGDDDSGSQQLSVSRFRSIEVQIHQLWRGDENQRHSDDANQCSC